MLAHYLTPQQNTATNTIMGLDKVLVNGSAYGSSKAVFTASIEGLYSFSWIITTKKGKHFHTYLDVNEKLMSRNSSGMDNYDNASAASQSVVIHMKKGEGAAIKTNFEGQYMLSGGWSTFSGFLIA